MAWKKGQRVSVTAEPDGIPGLTVMFRFIGTILGVRKNQVTIDLDDFPMDVTIDAKQGFWRLELLAVLLLLLGAPLAARAQAPTIPLPAWVPAGLAGQVPPWGVERDPNSDLSLYEPERVFLDGEPAVFNPFPTGPVGVEEVAKQSEHPDWYPLYKERLPLPECNQAGPPVDWYFNRYGATNPSYAWGNNATVSNACMYATQRAQHLLGYVWLVISLERGNFYGGVHGSYIDRAQALQLLAIAFETGPVSFEDTRQPRLPELWPPNVWQYDPLSSLTEPVVYSGRFLFGETHPWRNSIASVWTRMSDPNQRRHPQSNDALLWAQLAVLRQHPCGDAGMRSVFVSWGLTACETAP